MVWRAPHIINECLSWTAIFSSPDINECVNPENCVYGTCVNSQGSYICQCPPNYTLNPEGTGCIGMYQRVTVVTSVSMTPVPITRRVYHCQLNLTNYPERTPLCVCKYLLLLFHASALIHLVIMSNLRCL